MNLPNIVYESFLFLKNSNKLNIFIIINVIDIIITYIQDIIYNRLKSNNIYLIISYFMYKNLIMFYINI